MTDDDENRQEGAPEELLPGLSEDRPLDGLMPEMNETPEHEGAPDEIDAIHPRVLQVGLEEGREWTLACWWDPGPEALDEQLGTLVDATLLRALSRLPRWELEEHREYVGVRLFVFGELESGSRETIESLSFSEVAYRPDEQTERMNAWRNEAEAAEMPVPTRPESVWHLPLTHPDEYGGDLLAIESEMLEAIGEGVWGEAPGAMSRHLAEGIEERFDEEISLGLTGLEAMTGVVFPDGGKEGVRWTRPVFFQAICDFVGVVLHGKYGVEVQWGMCEPDERGNVPPPMFRYGAGRKARRIPVGRIVQEACVLPGGREASLVEVVDDLATSLASPG